MVQLRSAIPCIGILLCFQRIGASLTPPQYVFINTSLSWYEAQRFCRVKFTDLATVNDMNNKDRLADAMRGHATRSWIGLHRGAWHSWKWTDGSGKAEFTSWDKGEPNHGSADEWCAEVSSTGKWKDTPCGEEKGVVCFDREPDDDQEFVFYSDKKNWTDSLELCREKHTDMAAARTEEDNSEVVDVIRSWVAIFGFHKTAWIGLFRDSWVWSDGGRSSFRFWLRGVSSGGNCASVSKNVYRRWIAANCKSKNTFVCQGGLKTKKMVIRMKVRSDVDLNDSRMSDVLLKKLETDLRLRHVTDFKVSWRREKRGPVFQHEEDPQEAGADC